MNEWDDKRSHLNHDILRNQVLNEVMTLQDDPHGACPRLRLWLRNISAYKTLLDSAEHQTSFARILDADLFDCYDAAMKNKVGAMFHALFLRKTHFDEKIKCCRQTLDEATDLAQALVDKSSRTAEEVQNLSRLLYRLSDEISALPQALDVL